VPFFTARSMFSCGIEFCCAVSMAEAQPRVVLGVAAAGLGRDR
jgi:hypothetical protein